MKATILTLCTLLLLTACDTGSNIRETLGLNRNAPDEFKVVSRPPLAVPPDYALRPPRAGAPVYNSAPAHQQARAAATGMGGALPAGVSATAVKPVSSHSLGSTAEASLMEKLGPASASPTSRETLHQDHQTVKDERDSSLLGPPQPDEDKVLVDAPAEAERIKEKQQAGETVTGEDVRTREQKARSVIDQLF